MTAAREPLALTYHGVGRVPLARDVHNLFIAPDLLTRHIAKLKAWGYEFVRFGELAARVRDGGGRGCVSLTFDDGVVDNFEVLLPLLRARNLPATVFAVAGWLGEACPHAPWTRVMTADELRELARNGIEIGAHTMTHPDLTTLPYEHARRELVESRQALEEILQDPVTVVAYPYGRATFETRSACRDAGFQFGCRAEGNGSWDDPYDLPRESLGNGSLVMSLRMKRDPRLRPLLGSRPFRIGRAAFRAGRSLNERLRET